MVVERRASDMGHPERASFVARHVPSLATRYTLCSYIMPGLGGLILPSTAPCRASQYACLASAGLIPPALEAWLALTPLSGAALVAISRTMDYRRTSLFLLFHVISSIPVFYQTTGMTSLQALSSVSSLLTSLTANITLRSHPPSPIVRMRRVSVVARRASSQRTVVLILTQAWVRVRLVAHAIVEKREVSLCTATKRATEVARRVFESLKSMATFNWMDS